MKWLTDLFCPKADMKELELSQLEVKRLKVLTDEQQKQLELERKQSQQLRDQVEDFNIKATLDEIEHELISKYPPAKITYKGRSLPFSTTKIEFPVNCLITPYDPYIVSDLISWGLYNTGEDWETLVPKIYKKILLKYYKYDYDINVWGKDEVWELPFEMRAKLFKKGFDCDSWMSFQMSYYLAAGVPYFVVRGVAGDTSIGGHATVYVYSLHDEKWHHINSTYGGLLADMVSGYPTHDDAREGKDQIGITKVWMSWDQRRCYYDFKQSFPELKKFKIESIKKI